jgi:molybdate transport system regulatory protein
MSNKTLKIKCWIEVDESRFFGPGRAELLELIDTQGSVSKASKTMGMSYKKAWDMVTDLNTRSPEPFVLLQKGGSKGGSAELTEFGRKFLKQFQELERKLRIIAKEGEELMAKL